jgi:hypothetical protein
MSRDTTSRDVTLNALTALTGGLTAVAFVGTGLVTGLAADYTAQRSHAKTAANEASATLRVAAAPKPAATPRNIRRVVTTRVATGGPGVATSPGSTAGTSKSAAGGTSRTPRSRGAVRAPAPAPAPPAAPAPVAAPAPAAPPAPSAAS